MKVKLLRATMVAGVPTDSGTIVDVEQHTGEYLVAIEKAEAYGRTLGIELDKRQNKTTLIAELEAYIS